MPRITFIEHDGSEHPVDADPGSSLMQVAMDNLIPGFIADCGGNATCATCHCYIEAEWAKCLNTPDENEIAMLDCALHVREASRLSCQVIVTEAMDGLLVHIPVSQL